MPTNRTTEFGTGYFQTAFPNIGAPYGHAYGTLMNTSPMYVRIRCYEPALGEPHPVGNINVSFIP